MESPRGDEVLAPRVTLRRNHRTNINDNFIGSHDDNIQSNALAALSCIKKPIKVPALAP
jgi:hypothetical protein